MYMGNWTIHYLVFNIAIAFDNILTSIWVAPESSRVISERIKRLLKEKISFLIRYIHINEFLLFV